MKIGSIRRYLAGKLLGTRFEAALDDRFFSEIGVSNASGIAVTPDRAMQSAAVYASVRVLAGSVARLPLDVFRRSPNGDKESAQDHPLHFLLKKEPNPEQNSFEFREFMMTGLLLRGDAYSLIEFGHGMEVAALWPIHPDSVTPRRSRESSAIIYEVRKDNGQTVVYPAWRILHIKGLSTNGLTGISPISQSAQSIGVNLAAEQYAAGMFGNGSVPNGSLTTSKPLGADGRKKLRKQWEEGFRGSSKSGRVAIFEEDMKWQTISIRPDEGQFLETRKFGVREIARIFGLQPHKIQDLEQATFSNIEEENISFVVDTLDQWLCRWEFALSRALLFENEKDELFFEFNVDALLRGNITSRYQAYLTAIQNGWMNTNEVRRKENLNSQGSQGDVYWRQLNMTPLSNVENPKQNQPPPKFAEAAQRVNGNGNRLKGALNHGS